MTTSAGVVPAGIPGPPRTPAMVRLVHGELVKLTTTNLWRILAICTVVTTLAALVGNLSQAHQLLRGSRPTFGGPGGDLANANLDLQSDVVTQAASVFTSGQFFGGLLAMLLAVLLITNEYQYQTATATFLATPRRTAVVVAKFAVAMLGAALFWLIATAIDVVAGLIFFNVIDLPNHLGDWSVLRSMLLNLMAFALWPPQWVGVAVLLGYGLVLGSIGTLIIRRRDVT